VSVVFVDDDERPVGDLIPGGADEPFGSAVGLRAPWRDFTTSMPTPAIGMVVVPRTWT
jgi:hypothetical protein